MRVLSTACLLAALACFITQGLLGRHLKSDPLAWGFAFLTAGLLFRS